MKKRPYPKILVSLVLLAFAAAPLRALELKTEKVNVSVLAYGQLGPNYMDIAPLNDRISPLGYPTLPSGFMAGGFGGHITFNKIIFGGENSRLFGKTATSGNVETSLAGNYDCYRVGYVVLDQNDWRVYPMIGLGLGQLTFNINDTVPVSFNDILANPRRSSSIVRYDTALDFSLGIDRLTRLYRTETGSGGLVLGLKVGYIMPFFKGKWREAGREVTNGPDIEYSGFYVKLIVGIDADQPVTLPTQIKF